MHKSNKRQVLARRRERQAFVTLMSKTEQGRVQFLTPGQVETAIQLGRLDLVKNAVEKSDSADPFYARGGWEVLTRYFPEAFAVQTRCAGGRVTGHSAWAYGPVFLSKEAAKAAGFTHKTQCKCGRTAHPL